MIYYILLMAISFIYFFIAINKKSDLVKNKMKGYYSFIVTLLLILMAGFRGENIGRDTDQYTLLFNMIKKYNSLEVAFNSTTMERGYVILEYYIYQLGFDHQFFFMICAILTLAPIGYVFNKYSKNPWIAFFLFITFPIYTTIGYSAVRQGVAIGMVMMAFHYSQKEKLLKYLLFMLLAIAFHTTAIVFLPIFWLKKIKISKKVIIFTLVAMISGNFLNLVFLNIFNNYSRILYDASETGGQIIYLFFILLLCFSLFFIKYFKDKYEENQIYIYMVIITVIIWPICSNNPALFRLTFYFTIFLSLYVSNFVTVIRPKVIAVTGVILILFGGLLIFEKINKNPEALNYPYSFYWED
jgi:transmembrane protein EpsG